MKPISKCLVFFVLLNVVCKGVVKCSDGITNNDNISKNENKMNTLGIFFKKDDNKGCTGAVEQKLINGEKFLKNDYHHHMEKVDEELNKSAEDSIRIRSNQPKELLIHLFKGDKNNVASNDFYKVLLDCAKVSSAKPYLIDICVTKYLKKYNIEFSPTCLSCFSTFIGCSFISCNKQCAKDQCNNECKSCTEKNCFRSLLNCTKLDALPDPCK
ncbi:hypothetical protein MKS88_000418 [Plasmodium brasilianum]|uniref:Uncharacterized protein n=2 Tax=Plasmodium (Plasmodium) TaxID=418103 RepID=A0A1A8VL09_PLAMA|nr:conserved Plasmodium protein, unknown function [Plasmodium malariae]KAI4841183.1 hypothetical protein MKS88_000418 [Plasmodium brasilianum]SBS81260.1 conserved Plasmodium protein, unknown function [Plasmodium malariae]SBT74672.1 conserved Plasmodium protein, unknown function [Plasmodium malariae]SBT86863.1 conserved Plasmodium protein, unknown function [Plasmodium malariae]